MRYITVCHMFFIILQRQKFANGKDTQRYTMLFCKNRRKKDQTTIFGLMYWVSIVVHDESRNLRLLVPFLHKNPLWMV